MAKLPFTKLQLKQNQDVKTIEFNGQVIEVKRYLPIQTKLQMISNVLNASLSEDTEGFYNPVKIDVFLAIEIIENYTNITFTEKQREDVPKLYDLFNGNGILDMVYEAIGAVEIMGLRKQTKACVKAIYEYEHSLYGILKAIGDNKEILNLNLEELQKTIKDPVSLKILKEIAPLLGQNVSI